MQGKRILGFARGASLDDLEFAGLVALYDPPRAGVRESVATLKKSGVRVRPQILIHISILQWATLLAGCRERVKDINRGLQGVPCTRGPGLG